MMSWNEDTGAWFVGVDVAPFFAHEAVGRHDMVLGDLRRLPFPDGAFDKAWSLDVFEHLSIDALQSMLREANRVLAPGGVLFVYTHVRKNSVIAKGLRAVNALARGLERVGLLDMTQERLRKSDHLNPLLDVPHLEAVTAACGFRIGRIRYYTPIVGGFVENILMRVAERMDDEAGRGSVGAVERRRDARPGGGARRARGGEGPDREGRLHLRGPEGVDVAHAGRRLRCSDACARARSSRCSSRTVRGGPRERDDARALLRPRPGGARHDGRLDARARRGRRPGTPRARGARPRAARARWFPRRRAQDGGPPPLARRVVTRRPAAPAVAEGASGARPRARPPARCRDRALPQLRR